MVGADRIASNVPEARGLVPIWHPVYRDRYTLDAIITGLISNEVQVAFGAPTTVVQHIKAGRIRAALNGTEDGHTLLTARNRRGRPVWRHVPVPRPSRSRTAATKVSPEPKLIFCAGAGVATNRMATAGIANFAQFIFAPPDHPILIAVR